MNLLVLTLLLHHDQAAQERTDNSTPRKAGKFFCHSMLGEGGAKLTVTHRWVRPDHHDSCTATLFTNSFKKQLLKTP